MPLEIMTGFDDHNEPQRRRSARLSPTQPTSDNKMAPSAALVKRRITVRKIAPRKTTLAPSEHDKENTPKRAASEGVQQKRQKLSTPDDVQTRNSSSSGKKLKKSTVFSPIVPSPAAKSLRVQARNQSPRVQARNQSPRVQARNQSPRVQARNQSPRVQARNQSPQVQARNQSPPVQAERSTPDDVQTRNISSSGKKKKKKKSTTFSPIVPSPPAAESPKVRSQDPADEVWSQKVRRSYSRLSDRSPDSRLTLFGFEKLQTPEVTHRDGGGAGPEASGSFSALASFTTLLEAEDGAAEPDLNIPGVVVVEEKKKKRRRRKEPQMDTDQMEELAAKMNAEFEEAEEFELFVE